MNPNQVLQLYTALKLHFSTPSYDYFKYSGKLKNPPQFRKRKDKQFFAWLAHKDDPMGILVSNLAADPNIWIGNILQDKARDVYNDWKKRRDSLSYNFGIEFEKVSPKFPEAFIVRDGQHPLALKLYLQREISLETLTIINDLMPFLPNWDKKLNNDPIWQSIRLPLLKYRGFLEFDPVKFRKIIMDSLKLNA